MNTKLTYELTLDIRDADSAEYKQWPSQRALHWASHPAVASFEVREPTTGSDGTVRMILGFRSMTDWHSFVESDEHADARARLEAVTTQMDGRLWQRSSLALDGDSADEQHSGQR